MATEVAGITAVFEATDREFLSELRRIDRGIQNTSTQGRRQLRNLDQGWKVLGLSTAGFTKQLRGLLPVITLAAGAAGLTRLVTGSLSLADAMVDVADKVGLTTTELQQLRFAASEVGINAKTLDLAMQRFARRVGEAAQGSGELKDTLLQYNIAVRDAAGVTRNQVDVLRDLANAIQGADSEQERLRIAFKAFDSEGAAFVGVLKDGEAGLQAFLDEAERLGVVVGDDAVAALDLAADALRRFRQQASTAFTEAAGGTILFFQNLKKVAGAGELLQAAFRASALGGGSLVATINQIAGELDDVATAATAAAKELEEFNRIASSTALAGGPSSGTFGNVRAAGIISPGRSQFERDQDKRQGAAKANISQRFLDDRPALRAEKAIRNQAGDIQRATRLVEDGRDAWEEQVTHITSANRAIGEQELALRNQAGDIQATVRATEEARDTWLEVAEAEQRALAVGDAFTNSLTSGLEDAIFAGESLRDVLASLVEDVGRSIFQQTVGQGIGSFVAAGIGAIFGGARAAGGPVRPGKAFLVGEAGPELFSPNVPGVISPNGAGGGTTFNVDMRGASVEAVARLEAFVASLNANLERRAVSAVQFERQNDPALFA